MSRRDGPRAQIQQEQAKLEALLRGIPPAAVAARLKAGERDIVDEVPTATGVFAEIEGFEKIATILSPDETVMLLNEIFSTFDDLVEEPGMEKIKTIGDAYPAVARGRSPGRITRVEGLEWPWRRKRPCRVLRR